MSAGLDYAALMASADHTIRLSHQLDTYQFKCIITAPFSIGAHANFESPFEQFFNDKSAKLQALTTATNIAFDTEFKTFQIKTLLNTVSTWNGTDRPTFPLQIALLRYTAAEEAVHTKAAKLQSYLFPRIGEGKNEKVGITSILSSFLTPPAGYSPKGSTEAVGTWTLELGSWFRATNLILEDAQFEFSQAPTTDGSPLYATGSITLRPYRLVSDTEFLAYFRDLGTLTATKVLAASTTPATVSAAGYTDSSSSATTAAAATSGSTGLLASIKADVASAYETTTTTAAKAAAAVKSYLSS